MNMTHYMMHLFIGLIYLSCTTNVQVKQEKYKSVDIHQSQLQVKGANYVRQQDSLLTFSRFSEAALALPQHQSFFNAEHAKTNSGVRLRFMTTSSKVRLSFVPQPGTNRTSEYAVFQNGALTDTFAFNAAKSKELMVLEFENKYKGESTLFEVTLPSWSNVALASLELMGESELEQIQEEPKPVYLAIGNSITHGVGQGSAAYKTYPFKLSKALGYDYYNLAVGGAKVSQTIADMTSEMPKADLITILIGYNDLMFNGRTTEEYLSQYKQYLATIRKNHPQADIYCITLTYTRSLKSDKTGITPDDYRKALKNFVFQLQSEGDKRLHLIEGDKLTSEDSLRPDFPNDKVHLGYKGTALFADELYKIILRD